MFKVVKCVDEDNAFCVVPEKWENNGWLYWPPGKPTISKELLRQDGNSAPELDWTRSKCEVKFKQISSFAQASHLEKTLLECSDTEAECFLPEKPFGASNSGKSGTRSHLKDAGIIRYLNVDSMFDAVASGPASSPAQVSSQSPELVSASTPPSPPALPPVMISSPNLNVTAKTSKAFNSPDEVQFTEESITNAVDYANSLTALTLTSVDPASIRLLTGLNIKVDEVLKILSDLEKKVGEQLDQNCPSCSYHQRFAGKEFDLVVPLPIKVKEDMGRLEELLKNDDYKMNFIKKMSTVNGTTGRVDGKKAAYRLIDCIFDRDLLPHFSWTGKTKKEDTKYEFSGYKRIIQVFCDIVLLADDKYSDKINTEFFRDKILKYAGQRSTQKKVLKRKAEN